MGLAQSLRAVVDQFGGAPDDYEDYDDYDDDYDGDVAFAGPVERDRGGEEPRREEPRRGRGGSAGYDDIYRDESRRHAPHAGERAGRPLALVRAPRIAFALDTPQDFDDAQQIADRLRASGLVIVDLQDCGQELAKRLTDFCSGLTYAVDGSLQYIGEQVVLLAPHHVELSSAISDGLRERRFFNQA